MNFLEIEFPLAGRDSETIAAALEELGALSVTFMDRGDEPVLEPLPGEVRLWSDTAVTALFDDSLSAEQRLAQLARHVAADIAFHAQTRGVEDRVWEREWLKDWRPLQFGQWLWVYPTDCEEPVPDGAVVVRLDPGLAFGTGTHATTAQCLEVLESMDLSGRSVIDYGCGSGILCIAALKLGAASAIGVDLDPQALLALSDNALRNGVSDKIRGQPVGESLCAADCVVANILAKPLIDNADLLSAACKPGGDLILSGILLEQTGQVLAAYAPGFDMVERRQRDGWSCLWLRRRDTACFSPEI